MGKDKRRNLRAYRRRIEAAKYKARHSKEPTLCCFCGEAIDLDLHPSDGMALTLEHSKPLSHGGAIIQAYMPVCHRSCNTKNYAASKNADRLAGKTREW